MCEYRQKNYMAPEFPRMVLVARSTLVGYVRHAYSCTAPRGERCYNEAYARRSGAGGQPPLSRAMDLDERDNAEGLSEPSGDEDAAPTTEEQPLARVRYGIGKELSLYPEALVARQHEVDDELRVRLEHVRRLVLLPGEFTPSKLVLLLELDDDSTLIAAEGMTNVRDFRRLLGVLRETHPEIELDPPNLDEQLMQALDIKRRSMLGCYGFIFGSCVVLFIIYLVIAAIGHGHPTH